MEEAERYLDRAYQLALEPSCSGYPTYTDGIKTKADFETTVRRCARAEEDHKAFLYEENGKPAGLICFFHIPDEHYLQTVVFNVEGDMEKALAEFETYCGENFLGYDLFLGFPGENQNARTYLTEGGWELLEHSYNDVLDFTEYQAAEVDAPVFKVTRENFADFRRIHEVGQGDMYWNCDRLYENLAQWNIWLHYRNGEADAAIYYTNGKILTEIFGVDFLDGKFDETSFRELLQKALKDCKEKACRNMVFMNEKESQKITLDMGFRCVGEYLLFVKKV